MSCDEISEVGLNDKNVYYLEELNNFKNPIQYNSKTTQIDKTTADTLELVKSIDKSEIPIYETIYSPKDVASLVNMKTSARYYTTDVKYLEETQKIMKNIQKDGFGLLEDDENIDVVLNDYKEIKQETGLCEKYNYFDFDCMKFLNTNPMVLGFMSIYNIASPILSLFFPILIIILPIIIIKINSIELNLSNYANTLKPIIHQTSIGKLFMNYSASNDTQRIYLFVSAFFYCFSIYQNILNCVRFYSNMQKIHNYLFRFRMYLLSTILKMDHFHSITFPFDTYANFNKDLLAHKSIITDIYQRLQNITKFNFDLGEMSELGNTLSLFYEIYNNQLYADGFIYSFGFNGYISNLLALKDHIDNKTICKAKYTTHRHKKHDNPSKQYKHSNTKVAMNGMYYPKFINQANDANIISNDCNLNKNIILTGPNASGKTTFIKTLFLNTLLSQQIGYGCFKRMEFMPYNYFHCYLNIPDTSGRDSLFQAEARRCKDILEFIDNSDPDETHLCIFDELYSGTNPEEAIISAEAFIKYIANYSNVSFLLTTHYIKLCKKINKNENIINCNMKTIQDGGNVSYTYKLSKGISKIKSAIQVLKNMNYPSNLLLGLCDCPV
jgi:hypothetical protein